MKILKRQDDLVDHSAAWQLCVEWKLVRSTIFSELPHVKIESFRVLLRILVGLEDSTRTHACYFNSLLMRSPLVDRR